MRAASDETALTLFGRAATTVLPDRVVVTAVLRSAVHPEAPRALGEVADDRRALLALLRERHPDALIADGAIAVHEHHVEVEEPGRGIELRVAGLQAVAEVRVEAPAAEAAAVIASAGAFPGTDGLTHSFLVSPALERATRVRLQAEAIREARSRAVELAAAAELAVAGIAAIGEATGGWSPYPEASFAMRAKGGGLDEHADALLADLGEVRPEPVELVERVRVRFRLR